jgi:hypothetical protein
VQARSLDAAVELFDLDATPLGGSLYRGYPTAM